MKSVFNKTDVDELLQRLSQLKPDSVAIWGKMNPAQMLAHCNVTYEMIFENKHPKPNFLLRLVLKLFVKKKVITEVPYPQNGPTGPQFIINSEKDFNLEKERLIHFIKKVESIGSKEFEGRESHSFGPLTSNEWNNMMYKHLDHHFRQFGLN